MNTDPLAAEIAAWQLYLQDHPAGGEVWDQIKQSTEPILTRTAEAARHGHRHLALSRLLAAYPNLGAARFLDGYTATQLEDSTFFRREWQRHADLLRDEMTPMTPARFDGITPAAARAVAEIALPQVREYYEACADFERATNTTSGFFYLGYALAQRDLSALCRSLSGEPRTEPALRNLKPEIEALEDEVLRAYRPPVSIDRHAEFVLVGSYLKEARELTASGLRAGALLRYLQAALRFVPIRPPSTLPSPDELRRRAAEVATEFTTSPVDHTIGRIFLELAEAELAASPDSVTPFAAAALTDVLPRYLAAVDPVASTDRSAPPPAPAVPARVTVTFVRWPYT